MENLSKDEMNNICIQLKRDASNNPYIIYFNLSATSEDVMTDIADIVFPILFCFESEFIKNYVVPTYLQKIKSGKLLFIVIFR